jgi:hypothetical protein
VRQEVATPPSLGDLLLEHVIRQGANSERLAGFGLFATRFPSFEQRSESASVYSLSFRGRHNAGAALSLMNWGVALGARDR